MKQPAFALLALSIIPSCSHGSGRPAKLSDGGYSLSCKGPLTQCLHHAEHLCHDEGYTVSEARDVHQVLGAETGQSRIVVQKSDATIYCGDAPRPAIHLQREPATETTLPAPAVSAPPAPPAPRSPPAPVSAACVPGATQACVGPGGCSGGQACSADGSRFELCDCGK